jgi:hypothetical protein
MKEKTFWEQPKPNPEESLWKKIDDRQKKKKMTAKEPRTWEQDMDNIRETMRESCEKGTCIWPQ